MYNQGVYNRAHLSGAGTTNITTAGQFLHSININTTIGTSLTVSDSIGTIAVYGAAGPGCFVFNCKIQGTLTFVIVGAGDVTVSYM